METEIKNEGGQPEEVIVPEWVAVVEKALEKAAKYWTASDSERAKFDEIVASMELDLAGVARQTWKAHWDVDRIYHEMTGPDAKNPQVRELAVRLQEAGIKAHASAFLIGCPPKVIGPMITAGKAARAKAAEKVEVPVAS